MAVFSYTAKDILGASRAGEVDARSKETALTLLKNQGFYVITLEQKRESLFDALQNFRGVPSTEVVAFTRQFSTMISAGLPISRALEVLSAQVSNKLFKKNIYEILRAVEGGSSLSQALGKYPDIFSKTYQSLVKAGESSGKMDDILRRLADTMEDERELNSKFAGAMIYPTIVFIAMIGVFFVLMVVVVPKLATMYESMGVELPVVTRVMITTSNFMQKNAILIIIGAIAAVLGLRSYLKTPEGRVVMTEIVFKLPVFGKINKQKEVAQFTRTLSLLISSAVPIVESLNIVSSVVVSRAYRNAAQEAARQVEKGNPLSYYFKSNPVFPPILAQMASVGEETGRTDEVLGRIATFYDSEVDHLVKNLSAALEPIILVALGIMVGFLIISIITPIYKITTSI
jgi:type IV pilus assembly protein PilC